MRLRDRELQIDMQGEDVQLLHRELSQLGFAIPAGEARRGLFGPGTREAVLKFQSGQNLEPTGMVDRRTAALINRVLDGGGQEPPRRLVRGQLLDAAGAPVAGARVEAFDQGPAGEQSLGEAPTDARGAFVVVYSADQLRELGKDAADLLLRAFDAQGQVIASSALIPAAAPDVTVNLVLGAGEAPAEPPFVVRGVVRRATGGAVAEALVQAFDRDLRSEQLLGEQFSGADGGYSIRYGPDQFRRAEKLAADLVVRAIDRQGQLLAESAIVFNAGPETAIDLVVGGAEFRGPSEFELLADELRPLLEELAPAELREDDEHRDLSFLSGETGRDPQQLARFAIAHRLRDQTDLPAEVFYGLFRGNLPTELGALLAQSPEVQRRALARALADNFIPASIGELDPIVERLKQLSVRQAVAKGPAASRATIGALLSTAIQDVGRQEAFLATYVEHTGSPAEFWAAVRERPELRDDADRFRLTLQLGAITQNNLPLVRRLQAEQGGLGSLEELARFDANDWLGMVRGPNNELLVPPEVPGADDDERATVYARAIAGAIEDSFPTAVVVQRLRRDQPPGAADMLAFFERNADFDLATTRLDAFVAERGEAAFEGVADREGVATGLKALQRVYRVVPRYDQLRPLLDAGVDSAMAITRMGPNRFAARFGEALGATATRNVYARASQVQATAMNLFANYGNAFNNLQLGVLPQLLGLLPEGAADWEQLFGSLDLCACEHCRSVYSPAAYLVDILHFLRDRPAKPANSSAKEILFQRRPDLGAIELTCANTNTPLPYVDLVNEVLEQAVVPLAPFAPFDLPAGLAAELDTGALTDGVRAAFADPLSEHARLSVRTPGKWWTIDEPAFSYSLHLEGAAPRVTARSLPTSGTPAELAANPQYLHAPAYDLLRAEVYPWSLPFDLWAAELRTYLGHLGVDRAELMRAFQRPGAPPDPDATVLAVEELGLTPAEAAIIADAALTPPREPQEHWGFPAGAPATWVDDLAQARALLDRSGLGLAELLEILRTGFVNPGGALRVVSTDPDEPDTCDIDKLAVEGLDAAALGRLRRFARLWRRLGWSARELDLAITALRGDVAEVNARLDATLLVLLARLGELRAALDLAVEEALALWAGIGTAGPGSHYERLFQNPAVTRPVDAAFRLDGAELAIVAADPPNATIAIHAATVQAALGLSAAELAALREPIDPALKVGLAADELAALAAIELDGDALTLANLSKLYRLALLARGLKLPVRATRTLIALSLTNPFDPARPEGAAELIAHAAALRAARLSVAELDFLLRHRAEPGGAPATQAQAATVVLAELRTGLRKLADEYAFDPQAADPTGEATAKHLAVLLPAAEVERAVALLDGSWGDVPAMEAFVDARLASFLDPGDARAQLVGPPPALAAPEERFRYVLEPLLAHLRRTLSEQLVRQKLGEALGLDALAINRMLAEWVFSPADPARPALADFLDPAFVASDPATAVAPDTFPAQHDSFARLQKIASVAGRLRLSATQLAWLFSFGPAAGWPDLGTLPLAPAGSTAAGFAAWRRLLDLAALRDGLPRGEALLDELFRLARDGATTGEALLALLSERLGWAPEDLAFLAGPAGLNLSLPADFGDERALLRLSRCFALIGRLGAGAAQCRAWGAATLDAGAALAARLAARAKYDERQWLAVAGPLRDELRERQRAALVAYLVAHPDPARGQGWRDANGLYAHFLIDVEMSPCQLSSRIKQAIGSVQLFAQRCLMNLEQQVAADAQVDLRWREWKWMKSYRIWEANRKIFLYPENWIEPELRDDKSPFFKELEDELLQGDLTKETAELVFERYLEKLDQVARLDVVGVFHQEEVDQQGNKAVDLLHVFGRTTSPPSAYFYRRRVDGAAWTGWEPVDLDIEGEHIVPAIWNRRLHLFWLVFTEVAEEQAITMPAPGGKIQPANRHMKIQLAWSELRQGKWQPKRLSARSIEAPHFSVAGFAPSESFTCKLIGGQDELVVRVYAYTLARYPWPLGEFRFAGCKSAPDTAKLAYGMGPLPPVVLPDGTMMRGQQLVEFATPIGDTGGKLVLFTGTFPTTGVAEPLFDDAKKNLPVLNTTPGTYRVVSAAQDVQFTSQRPFFFQDQTRSFVVTPRSIQVPPRRWFLEEQLSPGILDMVLERHYLDTKPVLPDPIGPVADLADPLIHELTTPLVARNVLAAAEGGAATRLLAAGNLGAQSLALTSLSSVRSGPAPIAFGELAGTGFRRLEESPMVRGLQLVGADALLDAGRISEFLPIFRLTRRYRFELFYHPYVCAFVRELRRGGIDALLQRPLQLASASFFQGSYSPQAAVLAPYPVDEVDFAHDGAYALYNWELFFHVPLLIADRLMKNQRFEEAQAWFHYIFDPTDTSAKPTPQRYWRTRPFYTTSDATYQQEQIKELVQRLAAGEPDPELEAQVREWRKHPFKPHVVARLRTTAYQKAVVMKYLDMLIAWGDQLFRRDTIEALNEATQLYILAADILGRRPEETPPRATPRVQSFDTLEPRLDALSNAMVPIESFVPPSTGPVVVAEEEPPVTLPAMLYFCVPKNDKLLGYWDTVADRLFKLRNCMNLQGVVRQLPLFEPPIDPGLLVKAVAAGVDLSSALSEINAAIPHYRFMVMAQKAGELCGEVRALGAALLATLEKRDAESLALLRSSHELGVLRATRAVRQRQIDEAEETLASLERAREGVQARRDHYASIAFTNPSEQSQQALARQSKQHLEIQTGIETAANMLSLIPDFKAGSPTTIGVTFGGINLGNAMKAFAAFMGAMASQFNAGSSMAGVQAAFERRADEWGLQARLAGKEIEQIERQLAAARLRLDVAERELANHDLLAENARAMDDAMRDKYTNRELYDWMLGQIAGLYFQSYQLAYDLAKRAERAFRHELAAPDASFIQFGYWDSLKKGLMAGERLALDLRRMEAGYLDQHRREYELTRHVSLAMLDAGALVQLRQTGQCFISLPEALFDLDCPGHYMRRLKSVSVSLPCVVGPYTSVNATLTLLRSSVRRGGTLLGGQYARQDADPRFADSAGAAQTIVTSGAQSDSGLFEPSLRDERFLPFEGAGAISEWRLELPRAFRQFDYDTIADVLLHVRYTAREGGGQLRQQALAELTDAINAIALAGGNAGLARLISPRHDFPTAWQRFLSPPAAAPQQLLTMELGEERFPLVFQGRGISINGFDVQVKVRPAFAATHNAGTLRLSLDAGVGPSDAPAALAPVDGALQGSFALAGAPGSWTLTGWRDDGGGRAPIDPAAIEELYLVCRYTIE